MDYAGRRERVARRIKKEGLDGLLVTRLSNVRYLTGFSGSDATLWLTPSAAVLLSDGRYEQQIQQECPGLDCEIRRPPVTWEKLVARVLRGLRGAEVAFERDAMTVGQWDRLRRAAPRVTFRAIAGWVEELREIKDEDELRQIKQAIDIAERAFLRGLAAWTPNRTERHVAADLEYFIRQLGGEGCSFPPIVATGTHAALPHAQPRDVALADGDWVLIDWGARLAGYASDLTRVVPLARISPKLKRMYQVVYRAQQAAIAAVRPGVSGAEVDAAARAVIEQAGWGRHFTHAVGHGIGLEIHEAPRLAKGHHRRLKTGMVVTIEPGIYVPGWGGLRVEDDLYVSEQGARRLTSLSGRLADVVLDG